MSEPDYIEPKIPSEKLNKRKIIIYSLLAILAFLVLRAFYIAITYVPTQLGYSLRPVNSEELLPAFIGKNILLEETEQLESKDWIVKLKLSAFPEKAEQKDRDQVQLDLLINICSTPLSQRTPYAINHIFYNEDKKELFKFTMVAGQCQEFLSRDYLNRYYNEVFQKSIEKNIDITTERLPMYITEKLAARKLSFYPREKKIIFQYTQFPEDTKETTITPLDYDLEKNNFLQNTCSNIINNLASANGYAFSLVYNNPQGEVLHTTMIPGYSC